ncbi:hypothetical protein QWA68_014038 [Fusarium oxysporum]|nr:hypothetical protein QWA68_014038 [Fusarium oxysporum]
MDDSASKNQPPPYQGSAQDGHAGQTPCPSNNEWNHSLFNCFSPGDTCTYPVFCLIGCCFPYVMHGQTQARMRNPSLSNFSIFNGDVSSQVQGLDMIVD